MRAAQGLYRRNEKGRVLADAAVDLHVGRGYVDQLVVPLRYYVLYRALHRLLRVVHTMYERVLVQDAEARAGAQSIAAEH